MSEQTARLRPLDLVSPRVGIIRSLARVSRGVDEPSPPILYHAQLAHYDFRRRTGLERGAAGKGLTEEQAVASAIGEACERYCAHHAGVRPIRRAKRADLDGAAITPADCVLYADSQYGRTDFPYAPWNAQTETGWVAGEERPGGDAVWLPASLVYMNYAGDENQDAFTPPTSNGLAAGPDLESAALAGLCELAERDAFLIYWMNRLPAVEVQFEGGLAASIRDHYRRFQTETRVFHLDTGLPLYVMMAVSLSADSRAPAAIVGLGCHLDPGAAATRALFEICQVRPGEVRKYRDDPPTARLTAYRDVKTLEDHSAWFTIHEHLGELAFLLDDRGTGRVVKVQDMATFSRGFVAADLDVVVDGLVRAGCRVGIIDITTPDVGSCGIRVVRTFATGLQPIHFGFGEERLGGRRLFELPSTLGFGAHHRTEADLNPCPHPLA